MAGSITAGSYTAGVMDYLIEALEEWEKVKSADDVPSHQVVIDLLCGSSGGGMTGAMSLFALMDKMDHAQLHEDGINYAKPQNNILWNTWVELKEGDMIERLLSTDDIRTQEISSLLNSSFIDTIATQLKEYIAILPDDASPPPFLGRAPEMFMTLFNVTGINYELHSRSASADKKGVQYVSDHRDIAHFRWTDQPYPYDDSSGGNAISMTLHGDGRIPVSLKNDKHLSVLIDAAKATGAFPVGLKARLVQRPAKFLWDNPFFNKDGRFNTQTILLGKDIVSRDSIYTSLNSDGGTANNEPVELARNILLNMRDKIYKDVNLGNKTVDEMSGTEKAVAVKEKLTNTSIILIDPFPSLTNQINPPHNKSGNFPGYAWKLIKAMNSQMIFDAKDALDAYKKENYGLHIISPSRANVEPKHAIACGSLGGFGGFLSRDFRVHDFFLGRKNCQSFLRKYFVARVDEPDPENRACVEAVLDAYESKPEAIGRFSFTDEAGIKWLPIIPDVKLKEPIRFVFEKGIGDYAEESQLPQYQLEKLEADFFEKHHAAVASRFMAIANNMIKGNWFQKVVISIYTLLKKDRITDLISSKIVEDLEERKLVKKS